MRGAFLRRLADLATRDRRIVLLTGDLGYLAIEPFAERHPDRFFNIGVAEQNMVGIASGLAEAGFLPFVYSIVTFATLRPYEFIRNGPILHQFPVRIVGVGGGFEYGLNGPSHFGLEDIAVMRTQPGMTVIAPADGAQAMAALTETYELPGPIYYRLGKDERAVVPGLAGRYDGSGVQWLRDGREALILVMGSLASEAANACELLNDQGVSCALALVSRLSPAPEEALAMILGRYPHVFTAEAHYVAGGLGSLVAEVASERGLGLKLRRCGVRSLVSGQSGSTNYLHRLHGLAAGELARTVLAALGRPGSATSPGS